MKLNKVLNHKYFLYAAYALMVVNLLGYVSVSSMECIVVFTLATYLCKYCMSKNQALCIFVGLFVSNVLFGCGRVKEGLTGRREGNTGTATGTATLEGDKVKEIAVNDGGNGYQAAPTVTISGGGGSGATATASVQNGKVESISVTEGGSGYTAAPTVEIAAPPA
jgi:hypothetical protein